VDCKGRTTGYLIPEFGSSDNFIRSKDSHGDDFRIGVLLSGDSSTSHQILADLKKDVKRGEIEERYIHA